MLCVGLIHVATRWCTQYTSGHNNDFSVHAASSIPSRPPAPPSPRPLPPSASLLAFSTGGARFVLERMRRYPSSLLVQECGFYQLAAAFNKGLGVPRSSLALDVAVVVSRAMEAFSQVRACACSGAAAVFLVANVMCYGRERYPPLFVYRLRSHSLARVTLCLTVKNRVNANLFRAPRIKQLKRHESLRPQRTRGVTRPE